MYENEDGPYALPSAGRTSEHVTTLTKKPLCNICGRQIDPGVDGDNVILKCNPIFLEESEKSKRLRVVEGEFNLTGPLEGCEYLLWHWECIIDALNDTTVLGYYWD